MGRNPNELTNPTDTAPANDRLCADGFSHAKNTQQAVSIAAELLIVECTGGEFVERPWIVHLLKVSEAAIEGALRSSVAMNRVG
jgi:hypothetical protein